MGVISENYISQLSRGYFDIGDKYACTDCFDDYAIKDFIKANAKKNSCDYCGKSSDIPIAVPIHNVMDLIIEGILTEWRNPDEEGVLYETSEGGYQGDVFESYDLIMGEIDLSSNDKILNDIIASIRDRNWCKKDYYKLSGRAIFINAWENFSEKVKHQTRYVFLKSENSTQDRSDEEIQISDILDAICSIISKVGLITKIEKGTKIFRARIHDPSESFNTAEKLGPPKQKDAKYSNRMSPSGIPMFYGALNENTAKKEVCEDDQSNRKIATIATFESLMEFSVLDLTKMPPLPSLFDREKRDLRQPILFLQYFIEDLRKPINKDGREHIEYVPTQIFTEYIRHIYRDKNNNMINGILYKSAKDIDGISCVLFVENEHCCDLEAERKDKLLLLINFDRKSLI